VFIASGRIHPVLLTIDLTIGVLANSAPHAHTLVRRYLVLRSG